ncbi:MAG: hypothetical protein Q4E06_03670 [Lautropia sp.]|nr:hypothetical protein [Lautropia sp.]
MTTRSDAAMVVVGSSLAVLVAATERARRGLQTVIIRSGGALGGYFSGVHVMGRRRDAGMVLYEFSSFRETDAMPSLSSYDPMRRNDVGRFCGLVRRYVGQQQKTRVIDTPQMWTDGQWLPDMMLGNGIRAVTRLSCVAEARRQLLDISSRVRPDSSLCHPANKGTWPANGKPPADWEKLAGRSGLGFDCDSVSRIVHGDVLHEALFLPFARQVMNRDASHLSALYHRLPWLPLYWPESLLAELDGSGASIPPTLLSAADGESVAEFCQRLVANVRENPLITLVDDHLLAMSRTPDSFELVLAAKGRLSTDRLVWALTPEQGVALAGMAASPANDARLPLVLGFLAFREQDLLRNHSFVHAVSANIGLYRVTNSTACSNRNDEGLVHLVVEANPNRLMSVHGALSDDQEVVQAMTADMVRMELLREGALPSASELRRFDGALPLPTHEAVERFLHDQERLRAHMPGIELVGASAAPFAMGLSDQIVQGLQVADRGVSDSQSALNGSLAEPADRGERLGVPG